LGTGCAVRDGGERLNAREMFICKKLFSLALYCWDVVEVFSWGFIMTASWALLYLSLVLYVCCLVGALLIIEESDCIDNNIIIININKDNVFNLIQMAYQLNKRR
jgi:hypothetical protein